MKMFTFLGTSEYKVCRTYFNGQEYSIYTPFLQKHIYETYKDEIEKIMVFTTTAAHNKNWDNFKEVMGDAPLEEVPISFTISSEEFAKELIVRMDDEDEVIFDITFSFRELPTKLLFILKPVELMKKAVIRHIYYGQTFELDTPHPKCMINDLGEHYKMQKIAELLSQFDRTLIMTKEDWADFAVEDPNINDFMAALTKFNEMIEFCQLDYTVSRTKEIKDRARCLLKQPDKYVMLVPLAARIKDELPDGSLNQTKFIIEMIKLLLRHKRYQVAITFADQLYASVAVSKAAGIYALNTSVYEIMKREMRLSYLETEKFRYHVEQVIKKAIEKGDFLGESRRIENQISRSSKWKPEKIQNLHIIYSQNDKTINQFHDEIRNRMNHGQIIGDSRDVFEGRLEFLENSIDDFLKVIELMNAV